MNLCCLMTIFNICFFLMLETKPICLYVCGPCEFNMLLSVEDIRSIT